VEQRILGSGQEADIIDEAEIDAGKAYAQKSPKMNFIEMGIPIGAELVFNNNGEIATLVSEKNRFCLGMKKLV
jgi:hypothetical protein